MLRYIVILFIFCCSSANARPLTLFGFNHECREFDEEVKAPTAGHCKTAWFHLEYKLQERPEWFRRDAIKFAFELVSSEPRGFEPSMLNSIDMPISFPPFPTQEPPFLLDGPVAGFCVRGKLAPKIEGVVTGWQGSKKDDGPEKYVLRCFVEYLPWDLATIDFFPLVDDSFNGDKDLVAAIIGALR